MSIHKPVLLKEVLELLHPQPGEFMIDGTFGGGGHSRAIVDAIGPTGKLLAVDADPNAIALCSSVIRHPSSVICRSANFAELPTIVSELGWGKADGLLLDLGLSSDQLAASGRGFSFQKNEPLLMTLRDNDTPLHELLRTTSEAELASMIREYSDERFANRIAREIKTSVARGAMATTRDLRGAILRATPKNYENGRIDPATRTFLALRIYANHEFERLASIIGNIGEIIKPGGRVAIITFHSTEDRVVKNLFRAMAERGEVALVNKKVITASASETAGNPRARSAKLRGVVVGVPDERLNGKNRVILTCASIIDHPTSNIL